MRSENSLLDTFHKSWSSVSTQKPRKQYYILGLIFYLLMELWNNFTHSWAVCVILCTAFSWHLYSIAYFRKSLGRLSEHYSSISLLVLFFLHIFCVFKSEPHIK